MNPYPKLARLQVIERLHAECVQQLRAVSDIADTGAFGPNLSSKMRETVNRLERTFRELSDPRTYTDQADESGKRSAKNVEHSLRDEFTWLTDSVNELASLTFTHSLAVSHCDAILETIRTHTQTPTMVA